MPAVWIAVRAARGRPKADAAFRDAIYREAMGSAKPGTRSVRASELQIEADR